jgi:hypothetical protein
VKLIAKPAAHMKQEAVIRKDKMFCVKTGKQLFYVKEKMNFSQTIQPVRYTTYTY